MSKSSGETNTVAPLAEDDPLAELAKLVSAGSVFGNAADGAAPDAGNLQPVDPLAHGAASEARLTAPATEALDASSSSSLDFDAELGAQLEAELVSELYESAAPVVAEPKVETPAFAAPADETASTDEKISSALDDALNLDGFVSDAPIEVAAVEAIPEVAIPEPAQVAAVDAPDLDPQIDFESFEAEIAAAATSGFPAVDVPTPSAEFAPSVPVESSVEPAFDPVIAATSTPELGFEGIPASMPTGDVDPLDNIQFDTADDDYVADYENDNKSNGKGMLAIAAVLLVALVGGAGAYFIGAFDGNSGDPVVVAADSNPVRIKPDDPGGREIPNQDRTVYNTLDSEEDDPKRESRLVVRSEEPEVGDTNRPRVILPSSSRGDVSATVPPRGPRTVKTVIVRPDGTVVQPEDAVTVPSVTTPSTTSIVDTANTVAGETGQEIASAGEALTPRTVTTEALPLAPESAEPEVPSTQTETTQVAALPPIPRANNNRNQSTASQAQPAPQPTNEPTTLAPSTASSQPAANTGDFVVQLSAQRSDEAARTNFRRLQQRHSVLANYSLNVQRADLGDRGVYHRVRVGPFARSAANTLCERVKSQGGDCIVRRQ